MSEFIATKDFKAEMQALGPWTPALVDNMQLTLIESEKVVCDSVPVILSTIIATVTPDAGCVFAGHTFTAGVGTIMASSTKILCSKLPPIRENDIGFCIGAFVNNSSGATVPCSCKFKVTAAGQDRIKAK